MLLQGLILYLNSGFMSVIIAVVPCFYNTRTLQSFVLRCDSSEHEEQNPLLSDGEGTVLWDEAASLCQQMGWGLDGKKQKFFSFSWVFSDFDILGSHWTLKTSVQGVICCTWLPKLRSDTIKDRMADEFQG